MTVLGPVEQRPLELFPSLGFVQVSIGRPRTNPSARRMARVREAPSRVPTSTAKVYDFHLWKRYRITRKQYDAVALRACRPLRHLRQGRWQPAVRQRPGSWPRPRQRETARPLVCQVCNLILARVEQGHATRSGSEPLPRIFFAQRANRRLCEHSSSHRTGPWRL